MQLSIAPVSAAEEFRDRLRLELFEQINQIRVENDLAPLLKDPTAFRVAQRHCARQIFDGSFGHFASDGLAPYHRYSFDGGRDAVLENTSSWSSDTPYEPDEIRGLVDRSLRAMLDERPPDDGHRRAILDPWVTHLGTGIAWRGGEVRIAQEFLRRYITWTAPPPVEVTDDTRVRVEGRPIDGWHLAALSVHFESFPRNLRPSEASGIESWDFPADRIDYEPKRLETTSEIVRLTHASGGRAGDLFVDSDRSFTFSVPFTRGNGVYTLVAWVRRNGSESPLVAASNISMRYGGQASEDSGR